MHDREGVAAELQTDGLSPREIAQTPADGRGPRKRQHANPRVREHRRGERVVGERQKLQRVGGPARVVYGADEKRGGPDARRRRLQHQRASGGDRRRDFVRHEVQREVERRDRENDARRRATHQGLAGGIARRKIERAEFARPGADDVGRRLERRDRAQDLRAGEIDGLVDLRDDLADERLRAGLQGRRDGEQDFGPSAGRNRGGGGPRRIRPGDRALDRQRISDGLDRKRGHRIAPFRQDLDNRYAANASSRRFSHSA